MTATKKRTSPLVIVEAGPAAQLEVSVIRKMCYTKLPFFPKENINDKKIYIDIYAEDWKQGPYNHRHTFSNSSLRHKNALSKHYWRIKDRGFTTEIKWEIIC